MSTTASELEAILASELTFLSDTQRSFFAAVRIEPERWRLSPWGDQDGGFWVVAVHGSRVLWLNDIEDGFQVSSFTERGRIPDAEYFCNNDGFRRALLRLEGDLGIQLGEPQQLPPPPNV